MHIRPFMLPVLVVLALSLVISNPARAQDDKDRKHKRVLAGRLLKVGDKAMKRGDYQRRRKREKRAIKYYERALKAYEKAFELYPLAQIYFPIGLAEQKLGRHLDAIRHYQQLLDEVEDIKPALKAEVDKRIAEVKQKVVVLTIKVKPDGAAITIDGEEKGTSPLALPVFLKPGEHTIAVTAGGHVPYEKTVKLETGDQTHEVTMEKVPVVVKKPPKKKKKKKLKVAGPPKTKLWIGVGATAGMASFAVIFGIAALNKHGRFSDETMDQQGRDNAAKSGKRYALLSDVFWLGAIAAGAYTAYYYLKVYQPEKRRMERSSRRSKPRRDLWVAPYVGRGHGGVAAGGRF